MMHATRPADPRLTIPVAGLIALGALGLALTFAYDVGARPGGDASDVWTQGSALAPPAFMLAILAASLLAVRSPGRARGIGTAAAVLVATAIVIAGVFNFPTDIDAARSAGSPVWLTVMTVSLNVAGALAILAAAAAAARPMRRRRVTG